mgnify:CR=1 FL=1
MSDSSLYIDKRVPVFPRSVKGYYRNLKTAILLLAYGVYFLLPWIPWQRGQGPNQTILFDIQHRRFFIFDLTVYAQDIFWLAGFLIIGAFLLFYITGILGRVFCGYFCFQTLWTDVFIAIERLVQGERNKRIKLANQNWNSRKILLIATTWLLWAMVSFWTGLSFILYWGEANQLIVEFFTGQAPFPAYATTLFITATTLVMAGLAREQVCTYMCPYARFQSAMFDTDTIVVAYDSIRGEREKGRLKPDKKNLPAQFRIDEKLGDCIDCGYCVQVCPVGIDIRDGMQYQCITCALCIDACNNIMDAIKYPRGLIGYTSETNIEGKRGLIWLKPKNLGYVAIILIASLSLAYSIFNKSLIEMHVKQVRQPLYILLSDGYVQNRYDIKVFNKHKTEIELELSIEGLPSSRFEVKPSKRIKIVSGESVGLNARVAIDPEKLDIDYQEFNFVLKTLNSEEQITVSAQHFLPD